MRSNQPGLNAEALLKALASMLAPHVAPHLQTLLSQVTHADQYDPWVPHTQSPLGARCTMEAIRRHELSGVKRGKVWFVRRSEIDRYIASGEQPQHSANDSGAERVLKEVYGPQTKLAAGRRSR